VILTGPAIARAVRDGDIVIEPRRGSTGGRPVTFDTETYKGRNVVERAFAHIKQWRGLATRYDDHVLIYRGALVLHSIIRWLNEIRDTP